MQEPFKGVINVDVRDSKPDWTPFEPPRAPDGAPNVLYVVLDDVGFSAMSCYGGPIETPNIDRIVDRGRPLHAVPHHRAVLADPLLPAHRPQPHAQQHGLHHRGRDRLPERERDDPAGERDALGDPRRARWNTYMVGKWHLCPTDEMNLAAPRRNWPTGRGFERWYGFLGAETNQWYPDLVYDNHLVDQPRTPEEGYHLTEDITDKALEFIRDSKAVAPEKPFFLYYAPGACHAPHHAPKEWIDKLQGPLRHGLRGDPRADAGDARRSSGSSRRTPSCRRSTRSGRPRRGRGPTASRSRSSTTRGRGTR